MEPVPIKEIHKVLKEEPKILRDLGEFCGELDINPLSIPEWETIRHNPVQALRRVLEEFFTCRGDNATIESLCECLENFNCISGRGNTKAELSDLKRK